MSVARLGIAALAGSIVLSTAGQLCMKVGMDSLHLTLADAATLGAMIFNGSVAWTVAGLTAYVCSLALWLVVLMRFPLSLAYPMLSISYVLVYVGAVFWPRLAEPATPLRTLGTLLIVAGVACVSLGRSAPRPAGTP